MKTIKDEKTSEFPPFCPDDSSRMVWQSDFMASEMCYLDYETPMEEDEIIHTFACPECNLCASYLDLGDGEMQLIEVDYEQDEDSDEPCTLYTPFAIEHYHLSDE